MVQVHLANYVNTIVFCILASSASLLLLFFMYSTKEFVPYLLTAELGILAIVAYTVGVLLNTVTDPTGGDGDNATVKIDGCPDYYTRTAIGCSNSFVSDDGTTYTFANKEGSPSAFTATVTIPADTATACTDATYNDLPWSDLAAVCAK